MSVHSVLSRVTRTLLGAALIASAGVALSTQTASAADASTYPETARADALPTVQINGVVWDQTVLGNTVYAVGNFTSARPAGAPAGTGEVPRSYMLAYDIRTGELISSFAPTFNAQIQSVSATPDGSRIYVGGQFTQANGQARNRLAALDPTTGQLVPGFSLGANSTVYSVFATNTRVYLGGLFTSVGGGNARNRAAAIDTTSNTVLPFAPNVADLSVRGIYAHGDKVAIGGNFTTVNGSGNPGYGLALLDATTGASLPLPANSEIRNGGADAAVWTLTGDASGFYGGGYTFGDSGNAEGSFKIGWDGAIVWLDDCHGDTYDVAPAGDVVYTASHKHYCGNLGTGGFPQTDPDWTFNRATAFTNSATGTNKPDAYGYPSHTGVPSPSLLSFNPPINSGTFTGLSQGPWTVEASGDYVIYGGEFTRVNYKDQQGLVRFAKRGTSPAKSPPRVFGADLNPAVHSTAAGQVYLSWPVDFDWDDATLTYKVQRGDASTTIATLTHTARWWETGTLSHLDTSATPGSTTQYRIQVTDPDGNVANSEWVPITVAASGAHDPYQAAVYADGVGKYWRLGESGSAVTDLAGRDDRSVTTGLTRGQAGALSNSSNQAIKFNGTNGVIVSGQQLQATDDFSMEVWFKTSTSGKIMSFGNAASGLSSTHDRNLWIDGNGRVNFGIYPSKQVTIQSGTGYANNAWHHAVATLGPDGMALYVDGKRVARNAESRGQSYLGYWRIGGDSTWSGNRYFNGTLDEAAIYPKALTADQVNAHWIASGRASALPIRPTDTYGGTVYDDAPSMFWRLGETSGTSAADTSKYGDLPGTYLGNYTQNKAGAVSGNQALSLARPVAGFLGIGKKDGANVVATSAATAPSVFSQEVWIKTNATGGGRILGFGSSGNGSTSSSFDRMLYMLDNGKVRFGVTDGTATTIDSSAALNDNAWHHLVTTFGAGGMRLYVDGRLDASNPKNTASAYSGYWKIGGDNTWGGNSQAYFLGDVDEAAVYPKVLSGADVQRHYAASGRTAPNTAPTAAFSAASSGLSVAFDSAGSSDAEGPVTYAWDFGDGQTSTEANPVHVYTAGGTYGVSLTVKDALGLTATVSHLVIATAPNVAPTAAFTSSVSGRTVEFHDTSTDLDGSIAAWSWQFGDGATSTAQHPSHEYATGVPQTVTLTVTDNRGGTSTTSRTVDPDSEPTADFVAEPTALEVRFSSSAADDGGGLQYAWTFGDGGTSIAQHPNHTYAQQGTYQVTLVVTDSAGQTATATHAVTVAPAPNVRPTASFTSSAAGADVAFDGRGSSDPDGTVTGWTWDFGDGATGHGSTASHTYTASGTFHVKLTVTDDDGDTASVTRDVTVNVPTAGQPFAKDTFGRSVTNGWGAADLGGTWTLTGTAANYGVDGTAGSVTLPSAGNGRTGLLNQVSSDDTDVTLDFSIDKASTGGGQYVYVMPRAATSSTAYRVRTWINAAGAVRLDVMTIVGGTETSLGGVTVPGLTAAAGDTFSVRARATGTSPTTVAGKIWRAGTSEPAGWTVERTDATAGLQVKGAVGYYAYLSGSATNAPITVTFDNLLAWPASGPVPTDPQEVPPQEPQEPQNVAPTAAFSSSPSDLSVSFDATASADSDGTVVSYAWTFGDGATGSGATPTHVYAAAGAYPVSLTVTDDDGATATVEHSVTVTAPVVPPEPEGPAVLAKDAFDRVSTTGFGSADVGGAWTPAGSATTLEVAGGAGTIKMNAPGAGPRVYLNSITRADTDAAVSVSLDKVPTGGGIYVTLGARRNGTSEYRLKARFQPNAVTLYVTRLLDNTETTLATTNLATPALGIGDVFRLRLQVQGTSLKGRMWRVGETEPTAWQVSTADATPALAGAGGLVLQAYATSSVTNAPTVARFDDLLVTEVP